MFKLSCYCGYLVKTDHICGSENRIIPRNVTITRFDPRKKQTLKFVSLQIPSLVPFQHGWEFVVIQQEAFEVIDLESNLKNLYILMVFKSDSDATKVFVRLFCLLNFKYLKVCVEFVLPVSLEHYDNRNIHVIHGPLVCYADQHEVYLVSKNGEFQVFDSVERFFLLYAKCSYKSQLKHDRLNIIGISRKHETQADEVDVINFVVAFDDGELMVRKRSSQFISHIHASSVRALYIRTIREEEDDDDDDVIGDVVVATSRRQLIYFRKEEFVAASDLPFADASKIVEFCSSTGKKLLLVQSSTGSCCVADGDALEIMWTLPDPSEGWHVLVDDFLGRGSHQVLFITLPVNETPDVITIIDDINDDDDDDDGGLDADNDPKNWRYFLNDFSGLQCSNNLTKKEKEIFNAFDDDDDGDDATKEANVVPAVVLEAVDRKRKEAYLKLEEIKYLKFSKINLIKEAHRSMTCELLGVTSRPSVSYDLVNLLDDSDQRLRTQIFDDGIERVEEPDLISDVEIVGESWQGIFINKWIVIAHIRNNSKTRKMFNISLSCLGALNQLHVRDNNSPGKGESFAFKLKGSENKTSNAEFILSCIANQNNPNFQTSSDARLCLPEHLCSSDFELLTASLSFAEECYVVCSQDVPLFVDSHEISCSLFLHWNETNHSGQNASLASNEDFSADVLFAKTHAKHVGTVKLSDQNFSKLMFDPKIPNPGPECMSSLYAIFLAALDFTKLEIKSLFCCNLLNNLSSVLLGKLKFSFIQHYGFFWSDETCSYLNRCAVVVTKSAPYCVEIVVFFGSLSNLGYFIDKLYESFSRNLEIRQQNSLRKDKLIEKVYESLKKESLIPHQTHLLPVLHSRDVEQSEGRDTGDLVKSRARFEEKRLMMEDSEVNVARRVAAHKVASAVELLRSSDRAVSLLYARFEK